MYMEHWCYDTATRAYNQEFVGIMGLTPLGFVVTCSSCWHSGKSHYSWHSLHVDIQAKVTIVKSSQQQSSKNNKNQSCMPFTPSNKF